MVKFAHKTVFCWFLRKYCFLRKNCFTWKYLSSNLWKKGCIHFWRKMNPSPKKWLCSPKLFFAIFSENITFYKKIVRWKNIQNLISHKKIIFIFVARRPLPFKRDLAPRNNFSPFSRKIELLNQKEPTPFQTKCNSQNENIPGTSSAPSRNTFSNIRT